MNKHCLGADIVLLASIYYYVSVILSVAINKYGGAKRSRTVDPLHAMQVLYQLSYSPEEHPKLPVHLSDATSPSI